MAGSIAGIEASFRKGVFIIFGVGTTLYPILLLGGVTACLLEKALLFRKWISIRGAGILIALGAATLLTTIMVAPGKAKKIWRWKS